MMTDHEGKIVKYGEKAASHAQIAENLLVVELPKEVAVAQVHASLAVYYQLKVR